MFQQKPMVVVNNQKNAVLSFFKLLNHYIRTMVDSQVEHHEEVLVVQLFKLIIFSFFWSFTPLFISKSIPRFERIIQNMFNPEDLPQSLIIESTLSLQNGEIQWTKWENQLEDAKIEFHNFFKILV